MNETLTPMMKQYLEIKENFKDSILLFRLGDFYEMFFEDAVIASKILDIALTSRNKNNSNPVPLCGVPWHSVDGYITKLLSANKKVAVCEQVEDPKTAKGVVKREVVRVLTPGVSLAGLDEKKHNLLVSIYNDGKKFGLARVDASTGLFEATSISSKSQLINEIVKLAPREVLIDKSDKLYFVTEAFESVYTKIPNSSFESQLVNNVPGGENLPICAQKSASAIMKYLLETQKDTSNIIKIEEYGFGEKLKLDDIAIKHLELTETLIGAEKRGSLLWLLDRTKTSMGARKLHEWIISPLANISEIKKRQNAVSVFVENTSNRNNLIEILSNIRDLERLITKCTTGVATPKDLRSLGDSLAKLPEIKAILKDEKDLLGEISINISDPNKIGVKIQSVLVEDPPFSPREGRMISSGINLQLDDLKNISKEGKGYLAKLEAEEKTKTGIPVKVRYNKVFGYYIEVTKSHLSKIPDYYIRKQTLANAERFFTPELKTYEEKVLGAEEKINEIEYNEFIKLRDEVSKNAAGILIAANAISTLDCLLSLAVVAVEYDYVRPNITEDIELNIVDGRHPVVENILTSERFIPNDVSLNGNDKRLMIITGPNMAGKSTVMRQTALIVLLAQMGSFVPAKSANIGLVDRIFTRVGAADALIRGQSTFMVEMSEAAIILKEATNRSLIVIDEIGRGTSTFDGLAIAWSVAEDLARRVKARTLFATHYHELTDLAANDGIVNMNIAVREWERKVIFLRKLIEGPTSHSYGIQVGEMAGLPKDVVKRAREVLAQLEELNELELNRLVLKGEKPQMDLFMNDPVSNEIIDKLKEANLEVISPIEAMNLLHDLKKKIN